MKSVSQARSTSLLSVSSDALLLPLSVQLSLVQKDASAVAEKVKHIRTAMREHNNVQRVTQNNRDETRERRDDESTYGCAQCSLSIDLLHDDADAVFAEHD
jgi:hypothetical protein